MKKERKRGKKCTSPGKSAPRLQEFRCELGQSLQEMYPISKKQTKPIEPEWVTKLEEWGADAEKELGEAYKKRDTLEKEISWRIEKCDVRQADYRSTGYCRSGGRRRTTPRRTRTESYMRGNR